MKKIIKTVLFVSVAILAILFVGKIYQDRKASESFLEECRNHRYYHNFENFSPEMRRLQIMGDTLIDEDTKREAYFALLREEDNNTIPWKEKEFVKILDEAYNKLKEQGKLMEDR